LIDRSPIFNRATAGGKEIQSEKYRRLSLFSNNSFDYYFPSLFSLSLSLSSILDENCHDFFFNFISFSHTFDFDVLVATMNRVSCFLC